MTVFGWLLLLSGMLLVAALAGPWAVRRAGPMLASTPRLATAALTSGALLWITGFVFLGPLVAWMSVGPEWLPAKATAVCQRCLAASSPFGDSAITFAIPAFIPLLAPLAGGALIVVGLAREFLQLREATASLVGRVQRGGSPTTLLGYPVWVGDEDDANAYSLPDGRIVLSRGLLQLLSASELRGVLAHEDAHGRQRHHLAMAVLFGATRYFRWIPVISAVRAAVPLYLEIAADQAAQRVSGTTAIASALLKLGQRAERGPGSRAVALHAAGSERVRFLVGAPGPRVSRAMAASFVAYAVMLVVAVGVVYWPYLLALLTGCLPVGRPWAWSSIGGP